MSLAESAAGGGIEDPVARRGPSDAAGPTGRILLVEDEAWARAVGAYFEAFGFAVRTAARASEALELAREWPPDLLVADIHLHGSRTGIDVARRLVEERPGLPVVVLTGISDEELERRRGELEGFVVLRKPLRLLELAETVRRLIYESANPGAS